MSALARTTESDCYTRAANEDSIDGGLRTRTKYTYDANGNAITRNGTIIGWTSYNYPDGVGTATENATFDYGPDRQRWRMIYTGAAGTETTYYATPMFEVVHTSSGTDYRHYLFAGGRAVMQLSRSINGANNRPLLTDHQGSISTIMHGTGTSFVNESFTPYGKLREASTWIGSPTLTELANMVTITRQGYTFQTVLGTMGLNHMNARIEDAVTGRFLSPDTQTPDQTNTQNYNRFSYVNNNPLTFTDPTGHRTRVHPSCVDWCPSYAPSYASKYFGMLSITGTAWDGSADDGSSDGMAALTNSLNSTLAGIMSGSSGSSDSGDSNTANVSGDSNTANVSGDNNAELSPVVVTAKPLPVPQSSNDGIEGITVTGYYMDSSNAPPAAIVGANFQQVFSNSAFTSMQPVMNLAGEVFLSEIAIVGGPEAIGVVAARLPSVKLPAGGGLPAGGTVGATCILCSFNLVSDMANFGVDILETLEVPIEIETNNLGEGLGTALEAGQQAFEDALALRRWPPRNY
jgi:RHS repeat-associated protein